MVFVFVQWNRTRRSTAPPASGRCSRCACGALRDSMVASRSVSPSRLTTRVAARGWPGVVWTATTTGLRSRPTDRHHRCWPTWRPTGRTSRSDSSHRPPAYGWPCTRTTPAAPANARGLPRTRSTRSTSTPRPVSAQFSVLQFTRARDKWFTTTSAIMYDDHDDIHPSGRKSPFGLRVPDYPAGIFLRATTISLRRFSAIDTWVFCRRFCRYVCIYAYYEVEWFTNVVYFRHSFIAADDFKTHIF